MYRPRIIPVLLLKNNSLVKSKKFKNHQYIGDALNAVHLYNSLQADELMLLDIDATKEKRIISKELVKNIGEEARMPFSVGGGISTLREIELLLHAGAERVVINNYAAIDPAFLKAACFEFGSTTVIVCIDVKKSFTGKNKVYIQNGRKSLSLSPLDYAKAVNENGAGEIIIQSIDRDGMMNGYDLDLIKEISSNVTIPVTALGGAGSMEDLQEVSMKMHINGLAAGSLFVYQGARKGVLINYPEKKIIKSLIWN